MLFSTLTNLFESLKTKEVERAYKNRDNDGITVLHSCRLINEVNWKAEQNKVAWYLWHSSGLASWTVWLHDTNVTVCVHLAFHNGVCYCFGKWSSAHFKFVR